MSFSNPSPSIVLRGLDPDNHPLSARLYPESFTHLTGKTHFFGLPVATGEVWRIKGATPESLHCHFTDTWQICSLVASTL